GVPAETGPLKLKPRILQKRVLQPGSHVHDLAAESDLMRPMDPMGAVAEVEILAHELARLPRAYAEESRYRHKQARRVRLRHVAADVFGPERRGAAHGSIRLAERKDGVVEQVRPHRVRIAY